MSKVEGGGGPIDPPSRLRVTIFSRRLLGLKASKCYSLIGQCTSWRLPFLKIINPQVVCKLT